MVVRLLPRGASQWGGNTALASLTFNYLRLPRIIASRLDRGRSTGAGGASAQAASLLVTACSNAREVRLHEFLKTAVVEYHLLAVVRGHLRDEDPPRGLCVRLSKRRGDHLLELSRRLPQTVRTVWRYARLERPSCSDL